MSADAALPFPPRYALQCFCWYELLTRRINMAPSLDENGHLERVQDAHHRFCVW